MKKQHKRTCEGTSWWRWDIFCIDGRLAHPSSPVAAQSQAPEWKPTECRALSTRGPRRLRTEQGVMWWPDSKRTETETQEKAWPFLLLALFPTLCTFVQWLAILNGEVATIQREQVGLTKCRSCPTDHSGQLSTSNLHGPTPSSRVSNEQSIRLVFGLKVTSAPHGSRDDFPGCYTV